MTAVIQSVVISSGARRRNQLQAPKKMTGRVVKLSLHGMLNVNDHIVRSVADLLLRSHVVALPTDTIYGLAGIAQDNWAVRSIYGIKRRDVAKPLAICMSEIGDIPRWAVVNVSKALLEDLLPGPVTLVFERTQELNPNLNPGTNLVGVRIPKHDFIRRVIHAVGSPLALTSANVSQTQSSLVIEEFQELWGEVRLVVDGGRLGQGDEARLGSTVVDLSVVGHYRILRPGCAFEETVEILGNRHGLKPLR